MRKAAIIIGGGPAGLTAAYELLHRSDILPIVYELSDTLGGLAKTINYKGNRMDIGGHRFFSKSDRVMRWWQNILPIENNSSGDNELTLTYQNRQTAFKTEAPRPEEREADKVFLVRDRLSRIYFLRKFFKYPLSLDLQTIKNLGAARLLKIISSYLKARLLPTKEEKTLEDFFINRFGRELYQTFFKDYTEKVWGVSCGEISAEWGAQRVKGLSVTKTIAHALKFLRKKEESISQKKIETSLIEKFLYPKFGPGQIWEEVGEIVKSKGGEIHLGYRAVGFLTKRDRIVYARLQNTHSGEILTVGGDYFFSTMPIKDLVGALEPRAPESVRKVAEGLVYRDFITMGLLLKKMKVKDGQGAGHDFANRVPDNWIYVQDKDVKLGRLQVFNNWSPHLVKDPKTIWLGLEYFCQEGDDLWSKTDEEFKNFAIEELVRLEMIERADVLDAVVVRVPKTYPAYFGSYNQFGVVREYLDGFKNLFLIGRNGMHRYNNQDHSMLTAMEAVENILSGRIDKANIWAVNTEKDYHEEKVNYKSGASQVN